jgi:hypothetical protein
MKRSTWPVLRVASSGSQQGTKALRLTIFKELDVAKNYLNLEEDLSFPEPQMKPQPLLKHFAALLEVLKLKTQASHIHRD